MDTQAAFFSVDNVFFEIWGYPLSWLEFIGTLTGLISVWYASRNNILTWPIGLINVTAFFLLFYQVNLYSDMLLQIYFWGMSLYGWANWHQQADKESIPISRLSYEWRLTYLVILIAGTICLGALMRNIHHLLPDLFQEKAAYPFPDAFTTVASVLATILLARRKWESWVLWVVVDIVAVILYSLKEIWFVAGEYVIFLGLASFGGWSWAQKLDRSYTKREVI
ncbi:MAG: nicotinamide riboside transporter PnuC [Bacteroidota bacterium]